MAIKRLFGVTEIASTQFRSLSDAERHLKKIQEEIKDAAAMLRNYEAQFARVERHPVMAADLTFIINSGDDNKKKSGKIVSDRIDKIVIPKLDTLKKNFDVVDAISEKIKELEGMEANVAVNMKGMRGQPELLKAIKSTKAAADAQMKAALEYLETVGQKYAPTPFKEFLKAVSAKLNQDLEFDKSIISVYAWTAPTEENTFTVYIHLKNFKDDNGDIYPDFYIVFTCVLAPISGDKHQLSIEYYVTVMHDFESPGKFHQGRRVYNVKEAMVEIGHLLSMENISHSIGTLPHGLYRRDEEFKNAMKQGAGARVDKVEIDPSSLTFWFFKNVKQAEAQKLMSSMYVDVKALMSHIRGASLKMRQVEEDGRLGVKFSLINLAKEGQLNVQDLDWLKSTFSLRDDQVRDIVKVINKSSR
jgi:hypothetical protein